jgi:cytidine deaminase
MDREGRERRVKQKGGAPLEVTFDEAMGALVEAATHVREHAYAPYSEYRVGAAILTSGGTIFVGCNVENASYGAAICAERVAVGKMVAAGEREPVACAIVTAGPEPGSPCGICRQVLSEFVAASRDLPIALVALVPGKKKRTVRKDTTLSALFPAPFRLASAARQK